MWGRLLIEYHTVQVTIVLGLVLAMVLADWFEELKKIHSTIHSCRYMNASRSSTSDIDNTCIIICLG